MNVCSITVIGWDSLEGCRQEYNHLLGSIRYRAEMMKQVVLDTSPDEFKFTPKGLPAGVKWIHDPTYGFGISKVRMADGLNRCLDESKAFSPDVIAYLDGDEYFDANGADLLFEKASKKVVLPNIVHWNYEPAPYHFRKEHHVRLWPAAVAGSFPTTNNAWVNHPSYDGNPQRHTIFQSPGTPWELVDLPIHHHLRGAVGKKGHGSMAGGERLEASRFPWPFLYGVWREFGVEPMEAFK